MGLLGRCVALVRRLDERAIPPDTTGDVPEVRLGPLHDVVLGIQPQDVALALGAAEVSVRNPVGVLEGVVPVAVGPVLDINVAAGVGFLKVLDRLQALASRHEVSRHERIHVLTLVDEVHMVLKYKTRRGTDGQAILEEGGIIACRQVVSIVAVIRHETFRRRHTAGDVGLVALRTSGDGDGVRRIGCRPEEVAYLPSRVALRDQRAPGEEVALTAVAILKLRQDHRSPEVHIHGVGYLGRSRLTLLRGDEDGTIGCCRSIEGGCGGTGEDRDRGDIVRIDVRSTLRRAGGGEAT